MPDLVIVESPAKAKTIEKILGKGYTVKASVGHVRDLPPKRLGVDLQDGFTPEYIVIRGKAKVLDELRASAKRAGKIYLAPDPDREGEQSPGTSRKSSTARSRIRSTACCSMKSPRGRSPKPCATPDASTKTKSTPSRRVVSWIAWSDTRSAHCYGARCAVD